MFLSVGAGARLSRGVWEHAPQKMFDLGTPGKPVLSSFHARFPPIKQFQFSNFKFMQTVDNN